MSRPVSVWPTIDELQQTDYELVRACPAESRVFQRVKKELYNQASPYKD